MVQRIFNPEDGAPWTNKMMYHWCPAGSGDAHAMAYRAGAKLVNMEFSSWFSRLMDDKTLMFGSLTDGDGLSTPIVNAKGEVVSPHSFMSLEKYVEQEVTTPHELMRVVDCYNLADLAEVHLRSALNREDTRAFFWRKDFPELSPEWNGKVNFAYCKDGDMIIEKGEFPAVKAEYFGRGKVNGCAVAGKDRLSQM